MKIEGNGNKLPLKTTEEYKEETQEVTVCLAAAKELCVRSVSLIL